MLSNMESMPPGPTPDQAAAELNDAEASRARLARAIVVPSGLFAWLGTAAAIQIATLGVGLGAGVGWVLVAGVVVLIGVAGVQLGRFRRLNGVWLGGFASRVVLGTGNLTSTAYGVAAAAAIWAGYGARWWLVALSAVAGGAAYAFCGQRWMGSYRERPQDLGPGESTLWLVGLAAVAIVGLGALLLNA
jgi:hypothetical protein